MLADPMTLALIEAKTEERVLKTKTMKLSCKIKDEVSRFENGSQSYIKCLLEKSEKARHNYERAKRNTLIDQEETLKNRRLLKKSRSQSKLECKENNCFEIPYYH